MKILEEKLETIVATLFNSRCIGEKSDGTLEIVNAGDPVKIPVRKFIDALNKYGPLSNLDFPDIPEGANYEVYFKSDYPTADGKIRAHEVGDVIFLKRADARRLMLDCGKVRPLQGSGIPDLSIFAAFRYKRTMNDITCAKSRAEQEADRRAGELKDREKESGIFKAKEELEIMKSKKPFASSWK